MAGRIAGSRLFRYLLPEERFESLRDAGMWVARDEVAPLAVDVIDDLPAALAAEGVELREVDSLAPLRAVYDTTLHVSGIRLRNAASWQMSV